MGCATKVVNNSQRTYSFANNAGIVVASKISVSIETFAFFLGKIILNFD
jgi:hypothetical protein